MHDASFFKEEKINIQGYGKYTWNTYRIDDYTIEPVPWI